MQIICRSQLCTHESTSGCSIANHVKHLALVMRTCLDYLMSKNQYLPKISSSASLLMIKTPDPLTPPNSPFLFYLHTQLFISGVITFCAVLPLIIYTPICFISLKSVYIWGW